MYQFHDGWLDLITVKKEVQYLEFPFTQIHPLEVLHLLLLSCLALRGHVAVPLLLKTQLRRARDRLQPRWKLQFGQVS